MQPAKTLGDRLLLLRRLLLLLLPLLIRLLSLAGLPLVLGPPLLLLLASLVLPVSATAVGGNSALSLAAAASCAALVMFCLQLSMGSVGEGGRPVAAGGRW